MKKLIIVLAVTMLTVLLSAQTWVWYAEQDDWSGGSGQLGMSDWSQFYSFSGIDYSAAPLTLAYPDVANWYRLGTFPPATAAVEISKLVRRGDSLYAATVEPAVLAYTLNNGDSWVKLDTIPVDQGTCAIHDFEFKDGVIYAGGFSGGMNTGFVCRSLDGQTWDISYDQPLGADRVYDLVNISGTTWLAACGNPGATMDMDGSVFKSTDNCSTWVKADTLGYALITKLLPIGGDTIIAAGDAFIYATPLFMTTDAGDNWAPMANPLDTVEVLTTGIYDNGVLYVGDWSGNCFSSNDLGTSWTLLDTTELIADTSMITGFYVDGSYLYIMTGYPGSIYRSADGGMTLELVQELADVNAVSMEWMDDHTLAVGTADAADGARIYYTSYYRTAELVSSVIDMADCDSMYSLFELRATLNAPRYTTCTLKVRTDSNADMSTATDWASISNVSSPSAVDLGSIPSVTDGEQYLQYRIAMTTSKMEVTPTFTSFALYRNTDGIESRTVSDELEISKITGNIFRAVYSGTGLADLNIYDISGRNVFTGTVKQGENLFNTNLSSGRYTVRIVRDNDLLCNEGLLIIK